MSRAVDPRVCSSVLRVEFHGQLRQGTLAVGENAAVSLRGMR